jgi:large subunit ribosomal protein L21
MLRVADAPPQVPRKLAFAVVEVGPTQFRVSQGDTIVTEKLRGVDINDEISLNRVLMLGSRHETIIGRPFVPQAVVTAAVEVRDAAVAQLCITI